jgi:hygromycin-B 7''-O-kinase
MPRMPGLGTDERGIMTVLEPDDRRGVAVALGENLAEMQRLAWPFAGDFSTRLVLEPFPGGYTAHAISQMSEILRGIQICDAERRWIEDVQAQALASKTLRPNSFVHGDYKLANLTVMKHDDRWRVSGVFDLHTAHFGDGALDLARPACAFLDTGPALARAFLDAYRAAVPPDPALAARLPLYLVHDRLIIWRYFARPGADGSGFGGKTFREWAARYVDGILALL